MTDERIKLTDAAKHKLQFMLFDDGKSDDFNNQIRLFVVGGGCAGPNYGFDFSLEEDDESSCGAEEKRGTSREYSGIFTAS